MTETKISDFLREYLSLCQKHGLQLSAEGDDDLFPKDHNLCVTPFKVANEAMNEPGHAYWLDSRRYYELCPCQLSNPYADPLPVSRGDNKSWDEDPATCPECGRPMELQP